MTDFINGKINKGGMKGIFTDKRLCIFTASQPITVYGS